MPKRAQEQTRTGATGNQTDEAALTADGGDTPLGQAGPNLEGITPLGNEENPPQPPVPPPATGGRKRVKCEALKGGKIIIGKGEVIQIDEEGFFEVDADEAERLLTIPGYKEA
jgi:hypothetical protein